MIANRHGKRVAVVCAFVYVYLIYADPALYFSECNFHLFSALFIACIFVGAFSKVCKTETCLNSYGCVCVCLCVLAGVRVYACIYFLNFILFSHFRLAHAAIISSINKPPELALNKSASNCEHFLFIVRGVAIASAWQWGINRSTAAASWQAIYYISIIYISGGLSWSHKTWTSRRK